MKKVIIVVGEVVGKIIPPHYIAIFIVHLFIWWMGLYVIMPKIFLSNGEIGSDKILIREKLEAISSLTPKLEVANEIHRELVILNLENSTPQIKQFEGNLNTINPRIQEIKEELLNEYPAVYSEETWQCIRNITTFFFGIGWIILLVVNWFRMEALLDYFEWYNWRSIFSKKNKSKDNLLEV